MPIYQSSAISKQLTLLQKLDRIEDYLKDNPIYSMHRVYTNISNMKVVL